MRLLLVLVWAAAACAPAELPDHRPMVVDNVPYGADRGEVRKWHYAHDWCLRREWPTTDEFVRCDPRPYINRTTPAMYSIIRYDDAGWSISYAVFTPVPCTMEGRCDDIALPREVNADREFIDPNVGLAIDLAERGRAILRAEQPLPDMQLRMFRALAPEIDMRCGARTWEDPHGYGATWQTKRTEIGLFVASNGRWIVETHQVKPRSLLDMHPRGALARTE